MNQLLKQKRENFRSQIRSKELNLKFLQVRTANQSKFNKEVKFKVLEYARQYDFNFQDLMSLNIYLKMILDTWQDQTDELICQCLEILGAQYVMDLQIEWFEETILQTTLNMLEQKQRNNQLLDSILKLFINTSFHHDWVSNYLINSDIVQQLLQYINPMLQKGILKNIFSLIGNLVVGNSVVQAQFLTPLTFNLLSSEVTDTELMDEFLVIIRNLQHVDMNNQEIKMIILFWINNKPVNERLKDKYYQILNALTYQPTQAIDIFSVLYKDGLISDAINDLKHFKSIEYSEYCLSFLQNLSVLEYDFTMVQIQSEKKVLVNNGILEALTVHLCKDLYVFDTIYIIISNLTQHEDIFQQAIQFGLMKHLSRHIIYNTEHPNIKILREILQCLGFNVESYSFRFVNDFLDSQIDDALIVFIKSEIACYAREELLIAIKILNTLWSRSINRNATDSKLLSKLISIQLEEFSHQETNQLISLIDNYQS